MEPGIYRYVIKETSTSGFEGIAYSTEKKILDIYKYSDDSFDYRFFDEATGDKLSEANFTNTYNHAEGQIQDLTVSKTVTGKLGNLSKEFAFNIAINSSNNDEVYYVTKNGEPAIEQWNGSSTAITLKSGDSVTIYGLSANDSYTITEVEANANGYTTSIANADSSKDGTATGKITADTNVSYTNTKDAKNHVDYSAFLYSTTVCDGYARAYQHLMQAANIESYNIGSQTHAWNMIKLGNHYFHVDVTWDDGTGTGNYGYGYFLLSDNEIKAKGETVHASWGLITSPLFNYQYFWPWPSATYAMGDLNMDSTVDNQDVKILQDYILAKITLNSSQATLSDLNFDGQINGVDLSALRQKVLLQ